MADNKMPRAGGPRGDEHSGERVTIIPQMRPGSYAWRRSCGLLVLSDWVQLYQAVRWPRGPYRTALPEDRLRAAP